MLQNNLKRINNTATHVISLYPPFPVFRPPVPPPPTLGAASSAPDKARSNSSSSAARRGYSSVVRNRVTTRIEYTCRHQRTNYWCMWGEGEERARRCKKEGKSHRRDVGAVRHLTGAIRAPVTRGAGLSALVLTRSSRYQKADRPLWQFRTSIYLGLLHATNTNDSVIMSPS